jgi:hypothetical protein
MCGDVEWSYVMGESGVCFQRSNVMRVGRRGGLVWKCALH